MLEVDHKIFNDKYTSSCPARIVNPRDWVLREIGIKKHPLLGVSFSNGN